jgi:hypothetical protein
MINFGATGYAVNQQGAHTLLRQQAGKDNSAAIPFSKMRELLAKNPGYQLPKEDGRLYIRKDLSNLKSKRQTGHKAFLYQTKSSFNDGVPEDYVLFETYNNGQFQKVNLTG